VEDFENTLPLEFIVPEMAIGKNSRLDFSSSTSRGRARSFINTGFAFNGTHALTLDQRPYNDSTNVDTITMSYNLQNATANQLRYDFMYKNQGAADLPGNKVWIRGSENNAWIKAYDLFANQADVGGWVKGLININEILGSALPPQQVSSTFQIRIGQEGNTSSNTPVPEIDFDDGYTFDHLVLSDAINDVAITKIISPDLGGCALSATTPISIRVKNYHTGTVNNVAVNYQVDSGVVVTEMIPSIAAGQTIDYIFTQTANLSAFKNYHINFWVKNNGDNYFANDSILDYQVHNSPVITQFPYLQSFENSDGNFFVTGKKASWQWGTPAKTIINTAPNGTKCWVTNLTGNYNDNEFSYLVSPCFDISNLVKPVLSFSHIFEIELDYDFCWVEYSLDEINWQKLGTVGNGTNWYDNVGNDNWRVSNKAWHVASYDLPQTASTLRIRIVMNSDGGLNLEGIGIDDFHVFDKATIYTGNSLTGLIQNVSGNNWVDFTSGGKKIASINPNGTNLGATQVNVYPVTTSAKNNNNQYYVNRNLVIKPAVSNNNNIGIRFYFTAVEADSIVKANTCSTCTAVIDPYELGVTKYSGTVGDENNTLADNLTGFYQFISPQNTAIIPYDNGYYAEFTVNNFSEFWLSKGMLFNDVVKNCFGDSITFKENLMGTIYQWQQDSSGTGFTNISNNANFSGTNTNTLKITALSTSHTGNKYKCLVDNISGTEFVLRFINTWKGTLNNDWFNPANWSCGSVPDQYTDVIVPGNLINYPLVSANTAVRSIKNYNQSTVTLSAGVNLKITGN
jgi:hypothetical protein